MSSEYSYFDADKLKSIDSKTQFIVFGFVHDAQNKLFKHLEKNNPYFIIPDLICYIILGFYLSSFRFNIFTKDKQVVIAEDGTVCRFILDKSVPKDPDCVNIGDSNGRDAGECSLQINKLNYVSAFGITSNVNNILSNKWSWTNPSEESYFICIEKHSN